MASLGFGNFANMGKEKDVDGMDVTSGDVGLPTTVTSDTAVDVNVDVADDYADDVFDADPTAADEPVRDSTNLGI